MTTMRKKIKGVQAELADGQISVLENSAQFFLDIVFIQIGHGNFRLVISHNMQMQTYSSYPTIKGARIAFKKLYGDRAWDKRVKSQWSHFYTPDPVWEKAID